MGLNTERIESLVRDLPIDTPKPVAKAYEFFTSGYRLDTAQLINGAVFTQETCSMATVKDIGV